MKLLLIQRQARRDLQEAAAWYRERNADVAERFVAEVERTFEMIEQFPATGGRIPVVAGAARRLPVNDFPYHVVFPGSHQQFGGGSRVAARDAATPAGEDAGVPLRHLSSEAWDRRYETLRRVMTGGRG